jgi:hypothetical protein
VGLLLAIALALGALALGARGAVREPAGAELGRALAMHIACSARDMCASPEVGSDGVRGLPPAPGLPPSARRALPRLPRLPNRRPRGGVGARLERLGRAGQAVEGAWLACLGYGALRYDLEHPRTPRQMRPIGATLGIVGDCLNPWELLPG